MNTEPKYWNRLRFKDIGYLYGGLTGKSGDDFRCEENEDGIKPYLSFTNILNNMYIDFSQLKYVRMEDGDIQNPVAENDLLFLMSSEDYESIAKAAVIVGKPDNDIYLNSFCKGLRIVKPGIFAPYVGYQLAEDNSRDSLRFEAQGFTRINIKTGKIASAPIILPPLAEQIKMANYLDDKISGINAQIVAREKELQLLQNLKKAKVAETVTKGLSQNIQLKDSRIPSIGMIPAHWEVRRLKELFEFGSGLPISKADLLETGIPVISYGQIHAKFNRGTKVEEQLIRYVNPSYLETNPSSLVNKGDVIFADTSEDLEGCGNCVYIDKQMPLFAGYHTVILKCRKENPYLAYLFQSSNWREQIRKRVCGVKLYSITKTILNSVYVILPPIEEQIQTVEYLDHECEQIEKKCTLIDKQIQQLQLLKRALINEVVTGKKAI